MASSGFSHKATRGLLRRSVALTAAMLVAGIGVVFVGIPEHRQWRCRDWANGVCSEWETYEHVSGVMPGPFSLPPGATLLVIVVLAWLAMKGVGYVWTASPKASPPVAARNALSVQYVGDRRAVPQAAFALVVLAFQSPARPTNTPPPETTTTMQHPLTRGMTVEADYLIKRL